MDHYFRSDVIRQRLRVGPLSSYLDTFAEVVRAWLCDQHGAATTSDGISSESVDGPPGPAGPRSRRAGSETVPCGSATPGTHAAAVRKRCASSWSTCGKRASWSHRSLAAWMTGTGLSNEILQRYLLHERGLAAATIGNYLWVSRTFLTTHFNKEMVDPQQLRPSDVIRFVQRIAQAQPPSSAKFTITGLRAFLRFCTCKVGRPPISLPRSQRYPTGR